MNTLRIALALILLAALPAATLADNHGSQNHGSQGNSSNGSNHGSNGGNKGSSSGPSKPPPPPPPVVHNQGGFNLHHDINVPTVQVQHTVTRTVNVNGNRQTMNYVQSSNGNVTGGPYRGRFNGPVIRNPRNWGGWEWNRGIVWYPAPIYWGGGFWGPWAIDNLAAAILFGSIADYQDQMIYPSYEVEPDSPGAELLENYELQQTPCGAPNLVVIWGPDNSVICAYPNNLIAPGNYELDPTTLTITSSS